MADEPAAKRLATAASSALSGAVLFQECHYCKADISPADLHVAATLNYIKAFHNDCLGPYFQNFGEMSDERNEERRTAMEAWEIAESRVDPDCTDAETTTTPPMQSPPKRVPISPPPQPLPFRGPPHLRSPPAKEMVPIQTQECILMVDENCVKPVKMVPTHTPDGILMIDENCLQPATTPLKGKGNKCNGCFSTEGSKRGFLVVFSSFVAPVPSEMEREMHSGAVAAITHIRLVCLAMWYAGCMPA